MEARRLCKEGKSELSGLPLMMLYHRHLRGRTSGRSDPPPREEERRRERWWIGRVEAVNVEEAMSGREPMAGRSSRSMAMVWMVTAGETMAVRTVSKVGRRRRRAAAVGRQWLWQEEWKKQEQWRVRCAPAGAMICSSFFGVCPCGCCVRWGWVSLY